MLHLVRRRFPRSERHPGEGRDPLCKNYSRFLYTMDPGLRRDDVRWVWRRMRFYLALCALKKSYREMAADVEREAEALEWSEALIADIDA